MGLGGCGRGVGGTHQSGIPLCRASASLLRSVLFVFEGNGEPLVILSRRESIDSHFRKIVQVAGRTRLKRMASERPFERLTIVHHRRIKNPDLFSMYYKSTLSPSSIAFYHSPRYIHLFCPRSLDE